MDKAEEIAARHDLDYQGFVDEIRAYGDERVKAETEVLSLALDGAVKGMSGTANCHKPDGFKDGTPERWREHFLTEARKQIKERV